MAIFPGSSVIPIFTTVTTGAQGLTGLTGATGATGITGESLQGFSGATGISIIGATYYPGGGISFTNLVGNTLYAVFAGISGTSYEGTTPRGILIAKGLTTFGKSILYSFVDSYENSNEIIIEPNSSTINSLLGNTALYVRTFSFFGPALQGKSADGSYIYLVGKTYSSARPLGNTGEILYVSSPSNANAISESNYTEATNLLSVASGFDRHPIHNNQNVQVLSSGAFQFNSQNISGYSGATGYAFFAADFGQFNINNNKYQLVEGIKKADTTLYVGVSGSDNFQVFWYNI